MILSINTEYCQNRRKLLQYAILQLQEARNSATFHVHHVLITEESCEPEDNYIQKPTPPVVSEKGQLPLHFCSKRVTCPSSSVYRLFYGLNTFKTLIIRWPNTQGPVSSICRPGSMDTHCLVWNSGRMLMKFNSRKSQENSCQSWPFQNRLVLW
jgi:hypothetical protein